MIFIHSNRVYRNNANSLKPNWMNLRTNSQHPC